MRLDPWDPDNSSVDLMDQPDFDGQGKSRRQEAKDSMDMLGFVIFLALVIYPLLGIIGWLVWRKQ